MGAIDSVILYFINRKLANPVFDGFFIAIAESKIFLILIIFLAAILFWRGSTEIRLGITLALICVILLDPLTHYILKPLFARIRPCHELEGLRLIVGCGGRYGFPSNHAVNVFAAMTALSLTVRRYSIIFYAIAVLIGMSRIYLGRHYPSDVLAGAAIGIVLTLLIIYIIKLLLNRLRKFKTLNAYADEIQGAWIWKQK